MKCFLNGIGGYKICVCINVFISILLSKCGDFESRKQLRPGSKDDSIQKNHHHRFLFPSVCPLKGWKEVGGVHTGSASYMDSSLTV